MTTPTDTINLNLGSGFDYQEGWINIEADINLKLDLLLNFETESLLDHFTPNTVDHVLAQDILEHLLRPRALVICHEIYNILKPGGTFIVRMPHVGQIIHAPLPPHQKIPILYGGQDVDQGDHPAKAAARKAHPEFFAHKYGWTPETFHKELVMIGFTGATHSSHYPNFTITSSKPTPQFLSHGNP